MICNEKSIGSPWFSTNPQIMTLCTYKQGHTQLIYSTELTTEYVFEYFGGIARLLSPECGISCKTYQHHLETRAENVRDRVEIDQ